VGLASCILLSVHKLCALLWWLHSSNVHLPQLQRRCVGEKGSGNPLKTNIASGKMAMEKKVIRVLVVDKGFGRGQALAKALGEGWEVAMVVVPEPAEALEAGVAALRPALASFPSSNPRPTTAPPAAPSGILFCICIYYIYIPKFTKKIKIIRSGRPAATPAASCAAARRVGGGQSRREARRGRAPKRPVEGSHAARLRHERT
jgi:hypothetical protein